MERVASDWWSFVSHFIENLSHYKAGIFAALLPALIGIIAAGATASAESVEEPGASAGSHRTGLRLVLDEGEIVIALDREAAPDSIRTILDLVRPQPGPNGEDQGYYDGLALSHTWPHIELGTGVRAGDPIVIPQEIDAASLGFDTAKITKSSTAMNLWQFEFAEADERWKSEGSRPKQFEEWFQIFSETNSVDFLMETSIKEINEVLGYRYVSGRASLRARRGYVYLKPESKVENSPALRILLTDRPQLDGRVTVVGRVVEGLELATRLSVCELKTFRNRPIYEPANPVVIRRIEVIEVADPLVTADAQGNVPKKTGDPDDGRSTCSVATDIQPPEKVEPEGGRR